MVCCLSIQIYRHPCNELRVGGKGEYETTKDSHTHIQYELNISNTLGNFQIVKFHLKHPNRRYNVKLLNDPCQKGIIICLLHLVLTSFAYMFQMSIQIVMYSQSPNTEHNAANYSRSLSLCSVYLRIKWKFSKSINT